MTNEPSQTALFQQARQLIVDLDKRIAELTFHSAAQADLLRAREGEIFLLRRRIQQLEVPDSPPGYIQDGLYIQEGLIW